MKQVYGVEGNSTFLECVPRSRQAEIKWTMQFTENQQPPVTQVLFFNSVHFSSKTTQIGTFLILLDAELTPCLKYLAL